MFTFIKVNKVTNFLNEYGKIINREKKIIKKVKVGERVKKSIITKINLNYIHKLIELLDKFNNEEVINSLLSTRSSPRKYNLYFTENEKETKKKIYTNFLKWDHLHNLLSKHGLKNKKCKLFNLHIPDSVNFGTKPLALPYIVDAIITEITHHSDIGINNRVIVQLLIEGKFN